VTTSADLLTLAVAALVGDDPNAPPTAAGANVFSPGDWPTWDRNFPAILARIVNEDKTSIGRGTIEFTVISTLQLSCRVEAPADVDDGGAVAAEAALWALQRQVEIAIINSYPLTSLLQQFPFVRTQMAFSSEGEKHLAALQMEIGLEFYQGPEIFAPIEADDIDDAEITTTNFPGAGLSLDLNP
jgi:hypothetical protein